MKRVDNTIDEFYSNLDIEDFTNEYYKHAGG